MKRKILLFIGSAVALILFVPLIASASAETKTYTGKVLSTSGDTIKILSGSREYKVDLSSATIYTKKKAKSSINYIFFNANVQVRGKYSSSEKEINASKVTILSQTKRPNTLAATIKSIDIGKNIIKANKGDTNYTITYNDNTFFLDRNSKRTTESSLKEDKTYYFRGTVTGSRMTAVGQIQKRND